MVACIQLLGSYSTGKPIFEKCNESLFQGAIQLSFKMYKIILGKITLGLDAVESCQNYQKTLQIKVVGN